MNVCLILFFYQNNDDLIKRVNYVYRAHKIFEILEAPSESSQVQILFISGKMCNNSLNCYPDRKAWITGDIFVFV